MMRSAPVAAIVLLQAQQSEATVCTYPGGECYDLQLQKWKDGSWTLHGLWPEWKQDCGGPAFDYDILKPILPEMEKKWPSEHENKAFWAHEWSKHGSCTGMDQLTFFKKGLAMRDQYMSRCTGGQDCSVCFAKDLTTIETCAKDAPAPSPAVVSASNVSFCEIVSKDLPKECDCKDKPKGGILSCHVTVMNDTVGIAVDIAPCDSIAHMSLLITESKHGIAYPIENIKAGDVQQYPIPHLSFAIPKINGTIGLDAAASIDGNPEHLTVKAGFNACGVVMGHSVCGSQLTSLLPIWALHHTFQLDHFCESTKKLSFDVIV